MLSLNLFLSYAVMFLVVAGLLFYVARVLTKGRAQYERVEKQGGSRLLSKDTMNMAYWLFEPVGKLCVRFQLSPNQLSWVSFGFGILATVSVSFGQFGIAAWCLLLAGLLDVLDGMVARLLGINDPAGVVLDSSLDRYVDFLFLAGLVIYYKENVFIMIVVMLAMLGSFMISYSTAKAEAMHVTPPRGSMKRSDRMVYLIGASVLTPFSMVYIEQDWSFEPVLGLPILLVVSVIALMANISAVHRLVALGQAAREHHKTNTN